MEPRTLGERIRYLRKSLALTQTELAKQSGVTQPLISDLEAGNVQTSGHTPSIAAALGVDPLWLKTGLKRMNPTRLPSDSDLLIIPFLHAPGNCTG